MEILHESQMHTLSKLQKFLGSFYCIGEISKVFAENVLWKFPPVFVINDLKRQEFEK